ncbi:MAG: hypothetical protein LW630_03065 [Saprospiraceae bacterium]|jgi:predicted RNase H-related nuclease YkuK (DUF458 family)|nr:hypothetical protein [Saprospiraceae bacterium]
MTEFTTIKGEVVDAILFSKLMIKNFPCVQIHVGTDSQNYPSYTKYASVIAYRKGNSGVSFIFSIKTVPKVNDMWTRLWKEAEMSIQLAELLTKHIHFEVQIDMDFNEDQFSKSNVLIGSTKGWANSLGYNVNVKPHIQVATKAADHMIKT